MKKISNIFDNILEIGLTLFLVYALVFDKSNIFDMRIILFALWIKLELFIKDRTKKLTNENND